MWSHATVYLDIIVHFNVVQHAQDSGLRVTLQLFRPCMLDLLDEYLVIIVQDIHVPHLLSILSQ